VATKAPGLSEDGLVEKARANADRVGMNLSAEARDYRGPADVATEDVPVLRDDRAPVERLLDPQLGRRYVVDRTNDTGTATP
jgi:hypothetical protein